MIKRLGWVLGGYASGDAMVAGAGAGADRATRVDAAGRGADETRQGPMARISNDERQELAIRQSLRWAARSAREGDYERALEWLQMVERMAGSLPLTWRQRRDAWRQAWKTQAVTRTGRPSPRGR